MSVPEKAGESGPDHTDSRPCRQITGMAENGGQLRAAFTIWRRLSSDTAPGASSVPITKAGVPWMPSLSASRSEEHTSELQSLMRTSYAVFCLQKKPPETVKSHNPNTTRLPH